MYILRNKQFNLYGKLGIPYSNLKSELKNKKHRAPVTAEKNKTE